MPGAGYVRAAADGGQMKGGAPRVVWLTLGADPQLVSAHSAAERLNQLGRPSHLVWNPLTGQTVQLVPIVRAALALSVTDDLDHQARAGARMNGYPAGPPAAQPDDDIAGVQTEGRLCVQVAVVGFGRTSFTAGPLTGVAAIMDWLDSWQIPRCWPAGRPAPFSFVHTTIRSRRLWACGGHFGASQVPGCLAAGPGAIDVERLTGVPVRRGRDVRLPQENEDRRVWPVTVSRMDTVHAQHDDQAKALARAG